MDEGKKKPKEPQEKKAAQEAAELDEESLEKVAGGRLIYRAKKLGPLEK